METAVLVLTSSFSIKEDSCDQYFQPSGGAKMLIMMSLEERSRKRRETIETHRTTSMLDAEAWDLEFWQRQTPEERLSALVAIHRDIALVRAAKADVAPGS